LARVLTVIMGPYRSRASTPQLPLQLTFNDQMGFDQYHPGGNREAVSLLERCARGEGEPFIYLWGEAGTGKTHLLQACCRSAHRAGDTVASLPLRELMAYPPDILQGLESVGLVCIDDIQALCGNEPWELGVFHCYNRLRDSGTRLIVASRLPPSRLPVRLKDLRTRLAWGLTLQLHPLDDEDKLRALQMRARHLGLELTTQVARFLLSRYPRDLPSLWRLLDRLDHATLAAKRRLTIPFLKQYLEERG